MLSQHEIHLDECYTIQWRESKFTLIRCVKGNRISQEAIKAVMDTLEDEYSILLRATIVGYESLVSTNKQKMDSLEDHPGFKKIIELVNTHSDEVKYWINGERNIFEHRSGVLWKYIETTNPNQMTQKQLATRVIAWTPIVNGYETLKAAFDTQQISLQAHEKQNIDLKNALKTTNEIIARQDEEIKKLFEEKKMLRNQLIDAGMHPADMPVLDGH